MRWLTFAILVGLVVCVQTTLADRVVLWGCVADFAVILLVHYALQARTSDGPLAGWIIGLLIGLTSVEHTGLVAVAFGVAATAVWSMRRLMFLKHPVTHFLVTAATVVVIHGALRTIGAAQHHSATSLAALLGRVAGDAVYTGVWAVGLHRALLTISPLLGLTAAPTPRAVGIRELV